MRIGSSLSGIDLTAQKSLLRAYNELAVSSLRLSTMQRINSGSDDPAGLIAVEDLQAELASIQKAGDNAARAAGVVHVADSALGEVSSLLNTVRGNVVAAAGGGLSDAEMKALQIETDAALEAINYIGNVTSFGGQKLLDGSDGFTVSGVKADQVADVQVYANSGQKTLDIDVTQAAAAAELSFQDADAKLDDAVTLQVGGNEGTVTLSFAAGATFDQMATAINAATGNTGVTASVDGTTLTLASTSVGSEATMAVEALEGSFPSTTGATTAQGTDVVATVNGVETTGQGNTIAIHTDTLQADVTFAEGFSGNVDPMTVSGDGLTYVFSPDVTRTVSLGLPTVNTSSLGGAAGRLSELATGGSASLTSGNLGEAMEILDSAGSQILDARARAGAFEKYTIESSQRVLGAMEVNVSSALSQIFDTDVAAESSRLVRSQILVEAAVSSLMVANQRRGLLFDLFDQTLDGGR